jgi:predicted ABC-type ATPase
MSQDDTGPVMVIVAGPNGSGKSTTTAQFSKDGYEVIDPDRIARNLSPNSPEDYSVAAGRQAINRARENILQGNSFLVETTLSSKGVYQRLVDSAKQKGFSVKLAYISTEDPQINIARVADRVSKGGHNVPDEDVVRRYYRSLDNLGEFFDKADDKAIIDNSSDFLESGSKGRLQLEIDSKGDTTFLADKDDLASWVIESLGSERVSEALKNYISRSDVEHSEFYQTLKNKAQEIDSGDKDIDIEP